MSSPQGFNLSLGKLVSTLNILVPTDGWGQLCFQFLNIWLLFPLREKIQSKLFVTVQSGDSFDETIKWNGVIRKLLVENIFNVSLKSDQVDVVSSKVERWFLYLLRDILKEKEIRWINYLRQNVALQQRLLLLPPLVEIVLQCLLGHSEELVLLEAALYQTNLFVEWSLGQFKGLILS